MNPTCTLPTTPSTCPLLNRRRCPYFTFPKTPFLDIHGDRDHYLIQLGFLLADDSSI